MAEQALQRIVSGFDLAAAVRPIGDIIGLFRRLRQARIRIAVVTTDEHFITEPMLELGGIADMVDSLACSDGGLPIKPAPDAARGACGRTRVTPWEVIVVGDNVADVRLGRRAGVRICMEVLSAVDEAGDLDSPAGVDAGSVHGIDLLRDGVSAR